MLVGMVLLLFQSPPAVLLLSRFWSLKTPRSRFCHTPSDLARMDFERFYQLVPFVSLVLDRRSSIVQRAAPSMLLLPSIPSSLMCPLTCTFSFLIPSSNHHSSKNQVGNIPLFQYPVVNNVISTDDLLLFQLPFVTGGRQ